MSDCKTQSCIRCTVESCVYHTGNDSCDAGEIQVGNCTASTCSETCCDTFKVKM